MSLFTLIGRARDGMPLVATHDSSEEIYEYTKKAKNILKSFKSNSPNKCTIDAGAYLYHYIIQSDICYLCLTSKSYPKQLAFQYLEQLHTEFFASHGHRVSMFSRPYQAIAFGKIALNFLLKDPTLNRIRKEFIDPRSPDNLAKLNDNLTDIHDIMRKNIREVLHRGEKLDTMQTQASHLATASKKFKKDAEWANFMALVYAYIPFVAIAVIVLFVLYWRFA